MAELPALVVLAVTDYVGPLSPVLGIPDTKLILGTSFGSIQQTLLG